MKLKTPKLKNTLIKPDNFFSYEEVVNDVYFIDTSIPKNIQTIEFNGCYFKNVDFSNLPYFLSFYDCVFENCDLSNVKLTNSCFVRCNFVNTKLVGFIISNSLLQDVSFKECKFDYASFLESTVTSVLFLSSSIKEVRFFKVKYKSTQFHDCEIIRIENISTSLKDIDFSSCYLSGGTFALSDLRGIILNSEQVLEISTLFGIIIKDSGVV